MLFFKAAIAGLLALQAVALPTGETAPAVSARQDGLINIHFVDTYLNTTSDDPAYNLQERGLVSVDKRASLDRVMPDNEQYAYQIAKFIQGIVEWASNLHAKDMDAREQLLRGAMEIMEHNYPQSDGWHHFCFIKFKHFEYSVNHTPDGFHEETYEYRRKDLVGSHEWFSFVAFKGTGYLDKHGYDGGWANWAYDGGNRNGDRVTWN